MTIKYYILRNLIILITVFSLLCYSGEVSLGVLILTAGISLTLADVVTTINKKN